MLDGMDQQKTELPHFQRETKEASQEQRLTLRVVGAMMFGAPRPVMAVTNFENIPSKGAAASMMAIERMLGMQWDSMDLNRFEQVPWEGQPGREPLQFSLNPAVAAEHTSSSPGDKVPFLWPEGLHVSFDNTAADCKNNNVFRFLGMLVGIGVFRFITVSNLLVGHTHDIVDQMFSVWSIALSITDAPTLSIMQAIFREKYTSRIYELKEMMDQIEAQQNKNGNDLPPQIADRLVQLASNLKLQPHIVLQTFGIEPEGWLTKLAPLSRISQPHCFYIVKERVPVDPSNPSKGKKWTVMMYNRFLACSYKDEQVKHHYPLVRFGPWTTRCELIDVDQIPLHDPFRAPPNQMKTEEFRKSLQVHLRQGTLTMEQREEWEDLLQTFEADFGKLASSCSTCAQLVKAVQSVEVPSRGSSQASQQNYRNKVNEKDQARWAVRDHLYDEEFKEVHSRLLDSQGWWTKWVKRAKDVLTPYYKARELILEVEPNRVSSGGRLLHPPDLVRSKHEPPIVRAEREDMSWRARVKRPPQAGDVVIVRGTEITYPFWVGMITRSGADLERGVEESRRPSSKSGPKKSAAASTAPTKSRPMRQAAPRRSLKEAEVDSEEEDEEKERERESDFEAEEEKEEEEEEDEEEDPPAAAAAAV
jgi:hypothetical protein